MQSIARWLVARPFHGILALAATTSLALFSFLSGVVMVLLVLKKGVRTAALDAFGAGVLMVAVAVVAQVPVATVVQGAVAIWLPAMLLGTLLAITRSLTLTLQLSVIIALLAVCGFFLVADEPTALGQSIVSGIIELYRQSGLTEQADWLASQQTLLAESMTMVALLTNWSVHAASLVLGYKLLRQLPDETDRYGRFRDLNFGRVIALIMALASVMALLVDAVWLQSIAFLLFAVFWMQGLAIVHWLRGRGHLPLFGLVAVYVLVPFLNILLLMGLAVVGYIDAWFGFRRIAPANEDRG